MGVLIFWMLVIFIAPWIVGLVWGGNFGWWTGESITWPLIVAGLAAPLIVGSLVLSVLFG